MTQYINRRDLLALAAGFAAMSGVPTGASSQQDETEVEHIKRVTQLPPDAPKIAMLVHPKMVALDLIAPMTVFKIARFDIQLVWKDKDPVSSDVGIPIMATHTFEECPKDLDVLFIPGGILGTVDCMNDETVCSFVADRGARAKWVTSVCTGSLLLGAAGLLRGYSATSLWAVADLLPILGAQHMNDRVVIDRNRMTGGGVTAGVDFGLTLVSKVRNEELARYVQLFMEYSPKPPFMNGSPEEAGPERTLKIRNNRKWMDGTARLAAEAAAKRLGL